jgi:hypothetical protein
LTARAVPSSSAAPGELAEHEHAGFCRWQATYSLATRFMPSISGVTSPTSAAA